MATEQTIVRHRRMNANVSRRCATRWSLWAVLVVIGGFSAVEGRAQGVPQDERIAFTSEFDGDLFLMDVHTLRVTKNALSLISIGDLAYSRNRGLLALTGGRRHDHSKSLFLVPIAGGGLQRISASFPGGGSPYRPQFDPAGNFVYAVDYTAGLFRFSLDNRQWDRVTVEGAEGLHPQGLSFSSSGRLIAISPGDFKGFLIVDSADGHLRLRRQVLADFNSCTSAQWLNESEFVFAGRKLPGLQFLWLFNIDTGELRQLTHEPVGSRDFLSVSASMGQVYFTGSDSSKALEWAIWELPLDTLQPVKLTKMHHEESFLFPVWLGN